MSKISIEQANRLKFFRIINYVFWGIWLIVPFYISTSAIELNKWSEALIFSGLKGDCADPTSQKISPQGEIAINIYFVFDTLINLILLALMHFLVNDCANGRFLISRSISIVGYIAAVLIIWPIFMLITFNFTQYYLFTIGDINQFDPVYQIDVLMIGAGFFFIVLRLILVHAFKLQEEAKLTV